MIRKTHIAAALLLGVASTGYAAYPDKPVKIVVPYDPGTGADILARTLGQQLGVVWRTPVVVENRPGASTGIGAAHVQNANPDGYTLMLVANTLVLNKSLRPNASYDPVGGLAPILPVAIGQLTLVTHPSLNVDSVPELIALARKSPGQVDYASPGNGTPHHLTMELFKQATKADLTHVPFSNTGGAVQGLLGGHVKTMFLPIHVALPHVNNGKLRLLSSGGTHRAEATPAIPSLTEAAGVEVDGDIWYGLYAPKDTSASVVQKLNADVNAVLRQAEVRATFERQGLTPTGGTPGNLGELTRDDLKKWTAVVKAAKIQED
ncbi:Tripartite tricarboxylate transporter family receptor [Pigmentiphaga humi]|uniref:Tripartite tricarboxylate transporter family receptor n=1 Tax=Pigmentiphaga humi TaxID=2478468 RepID=A0A3P4AV83_9BURK|nr:tripartite tricarboxylate transporter substrate-binding protein [Pigmentiphaga humi]VCU67964.1 Tripartite tricarboxylate transporter family receptor [Pigmentiphaga humi]